MTDILREIGMISRALDSIANIEFKPYDLTKGQFLYLVRVCEQPGIIQERLGELIKVDRSTVIRAVQKLQRNGLVEKRPDQENKKIRRYIQLKRGGNSIHCSNGKMTFLTSGRYRDFRPRNATGWRLCCREWQQM